MADYNMTADRLTRGLQRMRLAVKRVDPLQEVNAFVVRFGCDLNEDEIVSLERYRFKCRSLGIYSGDNPITPEQAVSVIRGERIDDFAFVYVLVYTPEPDTVEPPPGQFISIKPGGMELSDSDAGWTLITGPAQAGKRRRGPFDE